MSEKVGTIVELSDGRRGTVVYNGLDGVGIKWGEHQVTMEDMGGSCGGVFGPKAPADFEWYPEAMLRDPYQSADLPCVGKEYMVIA